MKQPRYSIIPGGAVTDPRLEGRDLQVLCLLGRHTDKLGWCFRSQVEMAQELGCGRATVQRSLARLIEAGWIENRTEHVGKNGRPYASYAYRVRMDRDDPEIGPSESEVESQDQERGCPPTGTMPAQDGHQGAHAYVGTERPRSDQEDDSYKRANLISEETWVLTRDIASIAGIADDQAWPTGWMTAAHRVDAFLRDGYTPDDLLSGARAAMAHKRDGPPHSIEYFRRPWSKARGQRESPVPQPEKGSSHARSPAQARSDGDRDGQDSGDAHFGWLSVPQRT